VLCCAVTVVHNDTHTREQFLHFCMFLCVFISIISKKEILHKLYFFN